MKARQKRTWTLLTVMMIVSIVAVAPVSAYGENALSTGDEIQPTSGNFVSSEYASNVALLNLEKIASSTEGFSEWQGATIQLSTVFHDLVGNTNAYAFDVMHEGTYLGYMIISAAKDNYPVLEFSRGRIPTAPSDPAAVPGAQLHEEKQISGNPEYLYLGATYYYAKYPLVDKEGRSTEAMIVDLADQRVVDLQCSSREYSSEAKEWEQAIKTESSRLWQRIDEELASPDDAISVSTRSSSGYVSGVPYYLRGSGTHGCCPTAAGMVLAFWRSHGFPNLPLGSGGSTLIDELAVAMGTNSNGDTPKGNVVGGITTVFANHGYSSSAVSVAGDYLWVSWENCKNEIDAGRPFMLALQNGGTPVGGNEAYGNHAVTGVGYTTTQQNYVIVHDGWNPQYEDRYLAYGAWWWGTWLYTVKEA